jgi:hypothetical protein
MVDGSAMDGADDDAAADGGGPLKWKQLHPNVRVERDSGMSVARDLY